MSDRPVRVRMAPSPTGHLHVGTAYPALFNYLFAHANQGAFILRNEDTDPERSKPEYAREIVTGLKWLGLKWDEGVDLSPEGELVERGDAGPYTQSARSAVYREHLERMLAEGTAYWCYCTKEELEAEHARQEAAGELLRYAGTCSGLTAPPPGKEPQVIRARTPDKEVAFTDLARGEIRNDASLFGDMAIARSLDSALYNFAVVVDDITMRISHVIRGEDHIPNTPKQVLLFEALGHEPPAYLHLSLILAPDRRKLSKRRNKVSLLAYRDEGFLPEAMCNFLALLGWHPSGDQEIFSLQELIAAFSPDRVQKSGAIFDETKLRWLNREYMKRLPTETLARRLRPFLPEGADLAPDVLDRFVEAERGRADTLAELAATAVWLTDYVPPSAAQLAGKESPDSAHGHLEAAVSALAAIPADAVTWLTDLSAWLAARAEEHGKRQVFWPVRVALSGSEKSPDPVTLMQVLGREEAERRLRLAAEETA